MYIKIFGVDQSGNVMKVKRMDNNSNLYIGSKLGHYEDKGNYTVFCDDFDILYKNRAYFYNEDAQYVLSYILEYFEDGEDEINVS